MSEPTRRDFLKCSAGAALGMHLGAAKTLASAADATVLNASLRASTTFAVKKGLVINMLPVKMSYADRLKLARDAGFEVVQALTTPDERVADEIHGTIHFLRPIPPSSRKAWTACARLSITQDFGALTLCCWSRPS